MRYENRRLKGNPMKKQTNKYCLWNSYYVYMIQEKFKHSCDLPIREIRKICRCLERTIHTQMILGNVCIFWLFSFYRHVYRSLTLWTFKNEINAYHYTSTCHLTVKLRCLQILSSGMKHLYKFIVHVVISMQTQRGDWYCYGVHQYFASEFDSILYTTVWLCDHTTQKKYSCRVEHFCGKIFK